MTTLLAPAATIADSVRAAFNFSVDKFPLSGPEGMRTPHYGLFRSDTMDCVGVACKRGYEPHTVDDVSAIVEAAGSAFTGDSRATCYFNDGHFVTVAPSKEHRASVFGTADNIWPRLIIRAGYDGRAFRAELGYYRDACRNLAVVRSAGRSVITTIRHTAQLRDRMPELIEQFQTLAAGWDGVVTAAQAMDSQRLNMADFLRAVYPIAEDASSRTRNMADRRTESIIRRVVRERMNLGRPVERLGRDFMASAWEAFNGVQGYVQHDQRRRGRPSDFARAIMALDDAAVSRALELATAA